jgi:signal transduction histidine kinase
MLLQTPMFDQAIPIMGMVTGIVSMVVIGLVIVRVAQSQIGQAIARRLNKGTAGSGGDPELHEAVMELREQVGHLEQRLAESEERLDFTERMLASGKKEASSHG